MRFLHSVVSDLFEAPVEQMLAGGGFLGMGVLDHGGSVGLDDALADHGLGGLVVPGGEVGGVVVGEVGVEVVHGVALQHPHLVLQALSLHQLGNLLFQDLHRHVPVLLRYLPKLLVHRRLRPHRPKPLALLRGVYSQVCLFMSLQRTLEEVAGFLYVFDRLVVDLEGTAVPAISLTLEGGAVVVVGLFSVEVLVDDVLVVGDVVEFGAEGLDVFALADFAVERLELVGKALHPVPHGAEELVVHASLPEHLDELHVGEEVEDGVLHGLDLVVGAPAGDEVEVNQVGVVFLADGLGVHHVLVHFEVGPLADEAQPSGLEEDQVVVVVEVLDDLLRVAHPHLYLLGQVVEGLADEGPEEGDLLEDVLVRLLQVLPFHLAGQVGNELLLLLIVEVLPEPGGLLDVVVDLPGEVVRELVLVVELGEDL